MNLWKVQKNSRPSTHYLGCFPMQTIGLASIFIFFIFLFMSKMKGKRIVDTQNRCFFHCFDILTKPELQIQYLQSSLN